jgi:hypothetical protein
MKSAMTPRAGAVLFSMFVLFVQGVVHALSAFAAGKIKRPQSHPPTVIADASLRCRGANDKPRASRKQIGAFSRRYAASMEPAMVTSSRRS